MKITVINQDGWEKTFLPQRAIVRIGSDPNCDVRLPGNSLAPVHLQITFMSGGTVNAVNLGAVIRILRMSEELDIPSNTMVSLMQGDRIQIGNYQMSVISDQEISPDKRTANLEAALLLPSDALSPDQMLVGQFVIRNRSKQYGCQFHIEVKGLPPECVKIEVAPRIHAESEITVPFYILHRTSVPAPGILPVTFCISASEFPGEELYFHRFVYSALVPKTLTTLTDDFHTTESSPSVKFEEIPVPLPIEVLSTVSAQPESTAQIRKESQLEEKMPRIIRKLENDLFDEAME